MQVYWATIFIFPVAVTKSIESLLSAFLWKGTSLATTGAKVAWKDLCFPKSEEGLGLKRIKVWNQAATTKHIWTLLSDSCSIWSQWIHSHLIKKRPFWNLPMPPNPSWSWRKILQAREWSLGWFRNRIGNGLDTSLWYDYWLPSGQRPIDIVSQRNLSSTWLPWNATVARIIEDGNWNFPREGPDLSHLWADLNAPPSPTERDSIEWIHTSSGQFTIASAWDILREKRPAHKLFHLLWHPLHVPRQSFIMWMAAQSRLRTKDRMHWANMEDRNCKLYNLGQETIITCFFSAGILSRSGRQFNYESTLHGRT